MIFFYSRENAIFRSIENYKQLLNNIALTYKIENCPFLISNESLTSYSMFFRFKPAPYVWTIEPNSIARKLHTIFFQTQLFSPVKILITIRRQQDIIKSIYAQLYNLIYQKFRATKNFESFLHYSIVNNSDQFICDALHYDNIVLQYEILFGEENVGIFVFEEFKHSPKLYIKKIADFMNIDTTEAFNLLRGKKENVRVVSDDHYSSDERTLFEILSFYNDKYLGYKFPQTGSTLKKLLKNITIPGKTLKDIHLSDEFKSRIKSEFNDSNVNLSKRRNLHLDVYNYY